MTRGTPKRSIRIPDPLWNEAQEVADERGENLSEVLRDKLRAYVEEARATNPKQSRGVCPMSRASGPT